MRITLRPVIATGRTCGSCALCCKLLTMPELPDKAAGSWCSHIAASHRACGIYADRPQSCRDFRCAWLTGHLPEHWRPDKLKALLGSDPHEETLLHLHEDPLGPQVADGRLRPWLSEMIARGFIFCVHRGAGTRMIGQPALVSALLQRLKARGETIEVL